MLDFRSVFEFHHFAVLLHHHAEGAQVHVASPHFQEGLDAMRPLLASTPQIISEQVGAEGFGPMGELQID